MTERDQLIDNIIVSEIDYKKKLELLKTETDPEKVAKLNQFIQSDDAIFNTWCTNFNIKKADLLAVRSAVLTRNIQETIDDAAQKIEETQRAITEENDSFADSKERDLAGMRATGASETQIVARGLELDSRHTAVLGEYNNGLAVIQKDKDDTLIYIDMLLNSDLIIKV